MMLIKRINNPPHPLNPRFINIPEQQISKGGDRVQSVLLGQNLDAMFRRPEGVFPLGGESAIPGNRGPAV